VIAMNISLFVQKGQGKSASEDFVLVGTTICDDGFMNLDCPIPTIVAVIDGVGGNPGGRDASDFIAREFAGLDMSGIWNESVIREKLGQLNDELICYAEAIVDKEKMAVTISGIMIGEDADYLFYVGNVRVYVIQGSYLKQLTVDHTTSQMLRIRGDAEGAEMVSKSEITACMGGGDPKLLKQLQVVKVPQKVVGYVLTSDGIHDFLDEDTLEKTTEDINALVFKMLCEKASDMGSEDDKTIMVIRKMEVQDGTTI